MVEVDDEECRHICDKCIYKIYMYNRLRLPGIVIHVEYNNSESANVTETLLTKIMNRLSRFDSDRQCHLLTFRPRPV